MHSASRSLKSFRDLIARWPTVADFGRDIDVAYQTARKMNERDSIADVHWTAVIKAARSRGIKIALEDLARMKARPSRSAERASAAQAA
jgi:hypothetical protein